MISAFTVDLMGCSVLFIFWCYFHVQYIGSKNIVQDFRNVPDQSICLLFGTSPVLRNNIENEYFKNRIEAVVQLWKGHKIRKLILSGDKSGINYDEPRVMMDSCENRGIEVNRMLRDNKGFSTLETLENLKSGPFNHHRIVLISQRFHLVRAKFLAKKLHLNVVGYVAANSKQAGSFKARIREIPACVLAELDSWRL